MASFNDYVRDYIEMGLSRKDAEILAKETMDIKAETDAEWKQGKYKELKPAVKPKPHTPVFKIVSDHLGQQFNSTQEMCDFYKIPLKVFSWRRARAWSLKDALTHPYCKRNQPRPENRNTRACKDHLGHVFRSRKSMCVYWNISPKLLSVRLAQGWDLERALTTVKREARHQCKDHLGHVFLSKREMCKYWGISSCLFRNRLTRGWSLKKALTTPAAWKNPF